MPPKYITHNWSWILGALALEALFIALCFFWTPLCAILALLLLRTFYITDLGVVVDPANDRISFAGPEATLKPRDLLAPFKRKEIRLSQVTSVNTEKRGPAYLNRANAVCLSGPFVAAKILCDFETAAKALAAAIESEMGKPAPAVAPASAAAPSVSAKKVAAVAAAAGRVLELLCAILIFLVGVPIVLFILFKVDYIVNDGAVAQFILLFYE